MDICVDPQVGPTDGFEFLLVIHDGTDDSQLVFGRRRSVLMVIDGDAGPGGLRV